MPVSFTKGGIGFLSSINASSVTDTNVVLNSHPNSSATNASVLDSYLNSSVTDTNVLNLYLNSSNLSTSIYDAYLVDILCSIEYVSGILVELRLAIAHYCKIEMFVLFNMHLLEIVLVELILVTCNRID